MDTPTDYPPKQQKKRVLESFNGIIYLEDYIWVTKIKPKDKRPHYGHALMAYYWQNERLNEVISYEEKLKEIAQILEESSNQKKARKTSNNPGDTPTAG